MLQRLSVKFSEQSAFVKNVSLLTGATFFSQALGALTLPLLTRVYSPTDFGVFAIYSSILGIFAVIACLRYDLAISIVSEDSDAANLTLLSILVAIIASIVFFLFAEPLHRYSTLLLKSNSNLNFKYFWAVASAMFLVGASSAVQAWTARRGRYSSISVGRMSQAIGGAIVNISFGFAKPSPQGLIYGHMAYSGLGIAGLARNIFRFDREYFIGTTTFSILKVAKKNWRLPIFSVPEALFNAASWHAPVLLMISHVSTSELGQLMLATRVVGLPMTLIGASVSQVYLAEAPSRLKNGDLRLFARKTVLSLAKVGFLPLLMVALISPFAFPYLFGVTWQRAGMIMLWIVPWYMMQFICTPVASTLHILNEFRLAMLLQFVGLIVRVGFVLFAILGPVEWAIEFYATSGVFVYALQLFYIDRKLSQKMNITQFGASI
jgi:O-antigen/teichoic acid export membrane protein